MVLSGAVHRDLPPAGLCCKDCSEKKPLSFFSFWREKTEPRAGFLKTVGDFFKKVRENFKKVRENFKKVRENFLERTGKFPEASEKNKKNVHFSPNFPVF